MAEEKKKMLKPSCTSATDTSRARKHTKNATLGRPTSQTRTADRDGACNYSVGSKTIGRCSALVERAKKLERRLETHAELEAERRREERYRKQMLGWQLTSDEAELVVQDVTRDYLNLLWRGAAQNARKSLREAETKKITRMKVDKGTSGGRVATSASSTAAKSFSSSSAHSKGTSKKQHTKKQVAPSKNKGDAAATPSVDEQATCPEVLRRPPDTNKRKVLPPLREDGKEQEDVETGVEQAAISASAGLFDSPASASKPPPAPPKKNKETSSTSKSPNTRKIHVPRTNEEVWATLRASWANIRTFEATLRKNKSSGGAGGSPSDDAAASTCPPTESPASRGGRVPFYSPSAASSLPPEGSPEGSPILASSFSVVAPHATAPHASPVPSASAVACKSPPEAVDLSGKNSTNTAASGAKNPAKGEQGQNFEHPASSSSSYLSISAQVPLIRQQLRKRYHLALTAFRAFDLDCDNVLCFEEFAYSLTQKIGASEECVDHLWEQAHCRSSGVVRFVDFTRVFFPKKTGPGGKAGGVRGSKVRTLVALRLREKPKTASAVVGILEPDTTHEVQEVLGDWLQVRARCFFTVPSGESPSDAVGSPGADEDEGSADGVLPPSASAGDHVASSKPADGVPSSSAKDARHRHGSQQEGSLEWVEGWCLRGDPVSGMQFVRRVESAVT
ncbi:unnamed protein product [Amoebophrya sp. A25]|nr:unnamed protein product [Amoebophrya sp. A25]|eukprot:GSA25T00002631001.1